MKAIVAGPAAQRRCVMRTCARVSDLIQLDRAAEGDSIAAWMSATTSTRRRNNRTSTRHGVAEREVEEVLWRPMEDRPGREGSRVALGRTQAGRYLRVIYVPDPVPDSVVVITAYRLGLKALRALRRR